MRRRGLLFLAFAPVLGCGGGTDPEPVASVTVTAPATQLVVGNTLQLTATPAAANGSALSGRAVSWSSSNNAIATVSPGGLVSGVAEGAVQISATSEGRTGSVGLDVRYPYPRVAGSYAYAAVFDGIPSSSANGIGVIAVAQADRTRPELQLAPLVNWVVGASSYNFTSAYGATIATDGTISFRMGAPSTVTWQHNGTRTAAGGFTGRHTLSDGTSSNSGTWAMAPTAGTVAMMIDRGLVSPGTAGAVLEALRGVMPVP